MCLIVQPNLPGPTTKVGCRLPWSLLAEHQIDDPAAANVNLLLVAAMVEDVDVVAPGVLERVFQDRRRAEPFLLQSMHRVAQFVESTTENVGALRVPRRLGSIQTAWVDSPRNE